MKRLIEAWFWPWDRLFAAVVGEMECTFCAFYRGVAVGVASCVAAICTFYLTSALWGA